MKQYLFTASILENSNRIISSSEADWSKVMPGSYIKFPEDDIFYSILKNNKIFILKDFEVLDIRRIKLSENIGIKLNRGDVLDINYKQYELSTILKIIDKGQKYKENDIIEVCGGHPITNNSNNSNETITFIITDVNECGGVNQIALKNRGKYYTAPQNKVETKNLSESIGSGCKLELSYNIIPETTTIQREIQLVNNAGQNSVLILKDSLPPGIKYGSFSCHKWEAVLSNNYLGETKLYQPYEVYNDFTKNYRFPIPIKGSISTEIIVKEVFFALDNKIHELEEKINNLEKRLPPNLSAD